MLTVYYDDATAEDLTIRAAPRWASAGPLVRADTLEELVALTTGLYVDACDQIGLLAGKRQGRRPDDVQ
jgi:hypothetical protein